MITIIRSQFWPFSPWHLCLEKKVLSSTHTFSNFWCCCFLSVSGALETIRLRIPVICGGLPESYAGSLPPRPPPHPVLFPNISVVFLCCWTMSTGWDPWLTQSVAFQRINYEILCKHKGLLSPRCMAYDEKVFILSNLHNLSKRRGSCHLKFCVPAQSYKN